MALDDYRTLGRSGLKVSALCLGAMTFGTQWGMGADDAASLALIERFADAGGNFIDTANGYNFGHSEEIIGTYFAADPGRRHKTVLATKFGSNLHPGNPNGGGTSARAIIAECEASLRRLNTDYIDLYWQHWMDPFVPVDETLRALDQLVATGKVRYIGFSDTPAWRVAQAQTTALLRGWAPLIALQIEYSLIERTGEGELIPAALEFGLGVTPWAPLRSGVLSGKYSRENFTAESAGRAGWIAPNANERTFAILDVLRAVAAERGIPMSQAAIAWVSAQPGITAPIIGARTLEQLNDNLASAEIRLSEDELSRLSAASRPQLNFPAAFLKQAVTATYGGMSVNGQFFAGNAKTKDA